MAKAISLYETEMQTLLEMTDEERGRIVGALLAERLGEEIPELTGMEKAVYKLIIAQVNRADELSEKRRLAGKTGGAPIGNDNAETSKNNQIQAKTSKNNQNQANDNQKQPPLPLPLPLHEPCNLKRESKERETPTRSKNAPEKINYAEFVSLTNEEHASLVAKYGEEITDKCIEKLDNYKGSSGKKYQSDYRAILNWVVKDVQDAMPKGRASPTISSIDTENVTGFNAGRFAHLHAGG